MKDNTKGEPLTVETFKTVLKHLKNKNKNMFRQINKAGQYFQDAMYIYMGHLIAHEMVPDTYDYTKLFSLWKGKGSELDMMRYIHGKDWDAKMLEALVAERMKPKIHDAIPDI